MGQQLPFVLNLNGGLDLVSPHYVLQQSPGTAKTMTNYEPSVSAGYRRINGWTQFGTTTPTGGSDTILGVAPYADGVVAVAGSGVYFSVDGDTWVQVNRDTYVAQTGTVAVVDNGSGYIAVNGTTTDFLNEYSVGDEIRIDGNIRVIASIADATTMTLVSEIAGGVSAGTSHFKNGTTTPTGTLSPRTDQGRTQIAIYPDDGEYGSIAFTDENGNNDMGWFKVEGTGVGRTYFYDTLTEADFAAPPKPKYITQFEERIIVGNTENNKGDVAWSDRLSNKRFDGASAGIAQVDAPVLNVTPLRDRVVIFCRNSIHQLVELDDPNQLNTAILPVTYNVGTVNGWSVQEIGGDLIFLAADGIRTLKPSDQYGDVQFGNVARKIDPLVQEILRDSEYTISSTIIRQKNQYRLFYTKSAFEDSQQTGLVGTLKQDNTGQIVWQWSRLEGIAIAALSSRIDNESDVIANSEKIIQGLYNGVIGFHDEGDSFNGGDINASLELNEIDYGDIGRRKTLHYVRVFGDVEGGSLDPITMNIKYDYGDNNTAQPGSYPLAGVEGVSGYGTAVYGTDSYGGGADFSERVLVEGSGYSNKFSFQSAGQLGPYSINSLYIDMRVGPLQ